MKKSQLFSFSSFLKSLGLIVFLSLVNSATFAQPRANDPTFNPEDTGFGNGASWEVYTTAIQPDGKIIIGGDFTLYNGNPVNRIARLNTDGTLDPTFTVGTGANGSVGTVHSIAIQSDGKIIIAGSFESYNGTAVKRIARLNANGTLDGTFTVGTGATSDIFSAVIQSDGKIIIGGSFTSYNGTTVNRIARLNTDGTLDGTFSIGSGVSSTVRKIAIQSDGKILIGGSFTSYNGTAANRIARLNVNGTLDGTFSIGSGASSIVRTIAIQSNGKIIIGGDFTSYNATAANRIARLNADGSFDETFTMGTGAENAVYSIAIQNDDKIIIGGTFPSFNGTSISRIARLNTDGTLDETFTVGTGVSGDLWTTSIQPDGKIIIGGLFWAYNGTDARNIARINTNGTIDDSFGFVTGASDAVRTIINQIDGKIIIGGFFKSYNETAMNRIARLYADGTLDETFNVGTGANGNVYSTAIQSDGKIIIGGDFTSYNGIAINRIARLNIDGSLDQSFFVGTGASSWVMTTAIQSDGKIIIGGKFTSYNGVARNYLARLNADGSLDETFYVGTGANDQVYAIALQGDGKIIIGGYFTTLNGETRNRIACLNANGTLDGNFTMGTGANSDVYVAAIQSDGKIIIGGNFTSYNGVLMNRIIRLNADGSLDGTFTVGSGANEYIRTIVTQSDGKIIIGGNFTSYNGVARNYLARLNANGSLDETFVVGTGANGFIKSLALQSDGKILIGGEFTSFNGIGRNRIARILNTIGTSLPQVDESEVVVYPNPTKGNAYIDLGEYCQRANVEVFDICGKLVMQKLYNDTQILDIDIPAPAGIYFITITTANKRETLKLIKN